MSYLTIKDEKLIPHILERWKKQVGCSMLDLKTLMIHLKGMKLKVNAFEAQQVFYSN